MLCSQLSIPAGTEGRRWRPAVQEELHGAAPASGGQGQSYLCAELVLQGLWFSAELRFGRKGAGARRAATSDRSVLGPDNRADSQLSSLCGDRTREPQAKTTRQGGSTTQSEGPSSRCQVPAGARATPGLDPTCTHACARMRVPTRTHTQSSWACCAQRVYFMFLDALNGLKIYQNYNQEAFLSAVWIHYHLLFTRSSWDQRRLT